MTKIELSPEKVQEISLRALRTANEAQTKLDKVTRILIEIDPKFAAEIHR